MKIVSIGSDELLKDSTVEYLVSKISDYNSKLQSPYQYLLKLFSNKNEKGYSDFLIMVNIFHEGLLKTDFNLFSICALYTEDGWTYYLTTHEGEYVIKVKEEIIHFLERVFDTKKIKEFIIDISNMIENQEQCNERILVDEKAEKEPTNNKRQSRSPALKKFNLVNEVIKFNGYIKEFQARGFAVAMVNGNLKIVAKHSSIKKPTGLYHAGKPRVSISQSRKLHKINMTIRYLRSKGFSVEFNNGKLEINRKRGRTQVNKRKNRRKKGIQNRKTRNSV